MKGLIEILKGKKVIIYFNNQNQSFIKGEIISITKEFVRVIKVDGNMAADDLLIPINAIQSIKIK